MTVVLNSAFLNYGCTNYYYSSYSHPQHLCEPVACEKTVPALASTWPSDQKCDNFRLESLTWSGERTAFGNKLGI